MDIVETIIKIVIGVVCIVIGCALGYMIRKQMGEAAIGSAEEEAKRVINDAIKSAESKKREAVLEAKEEINRMKSEVEAEQRERRNEISRQERRLQQKEESMDRKVEALEQKDETLNKKLKETEAVKEEIDKLKEKEIEKLESISGLTVTEAKEYLLASIEQDVKHDAAIKIKEIDARLKEEAEEKARNIISLYVQ